MSAPSVPFQEVWKKVDEYIAEKYIPRDVVFGNILLRSRGAGLPPHNIAPNHGQLLYILAKSIHAERILEIGTLGAYSSVWMARALPQNGKLITLEAHPQHAKVAKANLQDAGLSNIVSIIEGDVLANLQALVEQKKPAFDFIFLDAKRVNPLHLYWALMLSRKGTLIFANNIIREGEIVEESSTDPSVAGARKFSDVVSQSRYVEATCIQTVGCKGYDGFALLRVKSDAKKGRPRL